MQIEIALESWVLLLLTILISVAAGVSLSLLMPWTNKYYKTSMPLNFGIGLSPFILGIASVLALGLFQGYSRTFHLLFTYLFILSIAFIGLNRYRKYLSCFNINIPKSDLQLNLTYFVLLLWLATLFINVIFFPVTKNDSLEYATVGKVLYENKSLLYYPVVDSLRTSSGLHAPWTHPPLYVALIYSMNIIQGDASNPLFMKIISLWFTFASVLLMFGIGSCVNKKVGVFSSLVFLSTPLNFLGSSDSLIDPLPILGMVLLLYTIFSFRKNIKADFLAKGCVLGLALWTHSEAILFIPLFLVGIIAYNGVRLIKYSFSVYTLSVIIAVLIAFYPYSRNYYLFGSLISDTPFIFSLKNLDWPTYFQISRGYYTLFEKIQFGLLKGWFVIDAYSLTFWLGSLGILFYLHELYKLYKAQGFINFLSHSKWSNSTRVSASLLAIFLCYHIGVAFSIAINIDLMIRNERYLLIMLPVISYFSGYALYKMTCKNAKSHKDS